MNHNRANYILFNSFLSLRRHSGLSKHRGATYRRRGEFAKAISEFNNAIELDP